MKLRHRAIGQIDKSQPLGQPQGLFKTVRQPRLDAILYDDAVNDDFDVMLIFLVERGGFINRVKFAVDAHAGEAVLLPLRQLFTIFAFAPLHHRGQQKGARAFGQLHHPVDHLRHRLCGNRQAGRRRIGHPDARP